MNYTKKSQTASITVFLSLILLLILSLVMTVIEGARLATARVFAERALYTSMDSVLAGFYGPLMTEYHLLGLDCPQEEAGNDNSDIGQKMKSYMSFTLNPGQGIDDADKRLNLYPTTLEEVEIVSKTSLGDYEGEILIHEITEYMKYRTVGDLAEFLLDKASLLKQPKKVSVLYEEKTKLEEELVTIDEGILALMRYIDGVSTGSKGLIREKGGGLKTEWRFVKQILYGTPTMESAGINNDIVFQALKDLYIDPTNTVNDIDNGFIRLNEIINAIAAYEANLEAVYSDIEEERRSLAQLEETLAEMSAEKTEENKENIESLEKSIEEAEDRISELKDKAKSLREDIDRNRLEQTYCISTIKSVGNSLTELASGSLTASEQAILELEQIIRTAREAKPLIESYERNLEGNREELSDEIYESLEEGLNEIKKYDIDNCYGYDFFKMKDILDSNYWLLSSCLDSLNKGYEAISEGDYTRARNAYSEASQLLSTYETEGLNINYSTLVIEEDNSPDLLGAIRELIEEGIVSLVIDPKTISDKEISDEMLPSIVEILSEDKEGFSFSNLFKKMKIGGKDSGTGSIFSGFGDYSLKALIGEGAKEIGERLLVQEYINDHFAKFSEKEEEIKGRKPSVLTYEREYLLYGNRSDKENLEAIIGRLILLRTLLNFTTILADKDIRGDARLIAGKLVGFLGLPILVTLTQGILMILLAFASALVDTRALLIGKEVAILKKKVELEFSDLLLLTRDNINKKAEAYKENGLSYNNYLSIFLCLTNQKKLTYRMMDLIQENIKIRYGTDFKLENCLFAYEAKAKFKIRPIFTNFSFIREYINTSYNNVFAIQAECSY